MGKGSETLTKLPDEAKPLFRNTLYRLGNLQSGFWGKGWNDSPGSGEQGNYLTNPGDWQVPIETQDPNAAGRMSIAPMQTQDPLDPNPDVIGGRRTVRRRLPPVTTPTPPTVPPTPPSGDDLPIDRIVNFDPARVPRMSAYQELAGMLTPQLLNRPGEETNAMRLAMEGIGAAERLPNDWGSWTRAGRLPTLATSDVMRGGSAGGGDRMEGPGSWITDPTIRAAREIFEGTQSEQIKNAMTQSGLGRSTAVGDSLARGWASQLMPLIESQLGRQERGIERQGAAEEAQLGREQAGIERGQRAREFASGIGMQSGQNATQRLLQAIGQSREQGALERGIDQEGVDADQRERVRLQALAEQSLFGPLGILPSTIGSSTGKSK